MKFKNLVFRIQDSVDMPFWEYLVTGKEHQESFWDADNVLFLHLGTGYMSVFKNSLSRMLTMYFKDVLSSIIYNSG